MKIIIPTYKRLSNQITLDNIHDKSNVILAVREEEAEEASKLANIFVLPKTVNDIATTREAIVKEFNGEKIFMPDDDVILSYYTKREGSDMASWNKCTPEQEKSLLETISNHMDDGYPHGGLWVARSFPKLYDWIEKNPVSVNSRYYTNIWYDLSRINIDKIDWVSQKIGEDFYVALQLCLMGHPSILRYDYAVKTRRSYSPGGCSEWRTGQIHNEYQKRLSELYPDYVKLSQSKNRKMNGVLLYNVKINFKKAYKDAIQNLKEVPNLMEFIV